MSTRIHTTAADLIGVQVCTEAQLVEFWGAEFIGVGTSLVIEDVPNGEAIVIGGGLNAWLALRDRINHALNQPIPSGFTGTPCFRCHKRVGPDYHIVTASIGEEETLVTCDDCWDDRLR